MNEVKIGDILYFAMFKGGSLDFDVIPAEVCVIRKGYPDIVFHVNYSGWDSMLASCLEYRLCDIGTKMFKTKSEALLSLKTKALNSVENIIHEISQVNSTDDSCQKSFK